MDDLFFTKILLDEFLFFFIYFQIVIHQVMVATDLDLFSGIQRPFAACVGCSIFSSRTLLCEFFTRSHSKNLGYRFSSTVADICWTFVRC